MSAFVVQDETINNIVSYLYNHLDQYLNALIDTGYNVKEYEEEWYHLAEGMFQLNCITVDTRYGKGEANNFRELDYISHISSPPSAIQTYKSLLCWLYQCNEGDIAETSLLYQQMKKIKNQLAHDIIAKTDDYEKARWD